MSVRRSAAAVVAVAGMLACAATVGGHEVRPAYLEITEAPDGGVEILWKQPVIVDRAVRLVPHLSNGWTDGDPAAQQLTLNHLIRVWRPAGGAATDLEGVSITIEGLERTITDVLVRVTLADGRRLEQFLTPAEPSLTVSFAAGAAVSTPVYLQLGFEHILGGLDHLAFVLLLLILIGGGRRLVAAVTAFTLAHSLTLALAALDLIRVNAATVEAVVALSIVFLAVELVHAARGRAGLTSRRPWLVPFAFGLLHGLAFAGTLAEVGLPRGEIALSLLLFNLGVELGQLLFIAGTLAAAWSLSQYVRRVPPWTRLVPPYTVGAFAAFWFIERLQP